MTVLVEEFWERNYKRILWRCFVPWMFYMICTVQYFSVVLDDHFGQFSEREAEDYFYKWATGIAILALSLW